MKRFATLLTPANLAALALFGLVAGGFVWFQAVTDYDLLSEAGLRHLAEELSWRGPLLYMLTIAVAVVISQLPGVPLTIAAGALWGPATATVYSVTGGFIGALIAYLLGRTLGRTVVRALSGKVISFNLARGERFVGGLILLTRLLPLFPFDVVSYAAGISGLSLRIYAPVTLIGMIPSTFLLTYLGASVMVSPGVALGLSGLTLAVLAVTGFAVKRYNLWGLRDSIRLE